MITATTIMNRLFLRFYLILGIVILSWSVYSCNDRPTTVGSEVLSSSISLVEISSSTTSLISKTENQFIQNPNPFAWFLGKTGTMEARTFINFNVPFVPLNLLFPDITANDIRATLVIPVTPFIYGDTLRNNLNFTVSEILQYWTSDATVDTLTYLERRGKLYGSTIGSFKGKPSAGQTQNAFIRVKLDSRTILSWMRTDTSVKKIFGLALLPSKNSAAIRRMANAAAENSYIEVYINRQSDTTETFYAFTQRYFSTFITDTTPHDPEEVVLQPGALYRSRLAIDLSQIPPFSFIHDAELQLTLDSLRSTGSNVGLRDTIFLKLPLASVLVASASSTTNTDPTQPNKAGKLITPFSGYESSNGEPVLGVRIPGTNKYNFRAHIAYRKNEQGNLIPDYGTPLASLIEQLMVVKPSDRYLLLQSSREFIYVKEENQEYRDAREYLDLSKLIFYGLNESDSAKRPQLRITYSPRKQ